MEYLCLTLICQSRKQWVKLPFAITAFVCVHVKSLHSCLTLWDPMDCSPPGSSVHGILQARMLEWIAMPSSRGSHRPGHWTQLSHIEGEFFTIWATREAHHSPYPPESQCTKNQNSVFPYLLAASANPQRWSEHASFPPRILPHLQFCQLLPLYLPLPNWFDCPYWPIVVLSYAFGTISPDQEIPMGKVGGLVSAPLPRPPWPDPFSMSALNSI